MDSDTALLPDAIENAVRVLRETPDCEMVQGICAPDPLYDDGPVEAYRVLFEHYWRRRGVGRRSVTLFTASLVTRATWPLLRQRRFAPIAPPCRDRRGGAPAYRRGTGLHVGFLGRIARELFSVVRSLDAYEALFESVRERVGDRWA